MSGSVNKAILIGNVGKGEKRWTTEIVLNDFHAHLVLLDKPTGTRPPAGDADDYEGPMSGGWDDDTMGGR